MSNQQQQQQQPVHEENNDPFLELEPQTLFHHEHEHDGHNPHSHNTRIRVDENDIDPSLHEGQDQDQRSSGSRTRLTDFASHILGSQDGDHHDHEDGHEHEHERGHGELSFTGENGVLESSNHPFHAIDEDVDVDVDEGEFEPHLEEGHEEEGEGEFVGESQTPGPNHVVLPSQGQIQRVGRKRGAYGKRKRNGEDEVVIKKQNHKEVERKRRNNISEGIDQLVQQMGIPELEKAGKSVQLRRASEWMAELGERVGGLEKEVGELRGEKLDLEANLALTSQRYTEEHERCTRYETLWRDAQDREAKGQFEIAQLLDEISQLRAKR